MVYLVHSQIVSRKIDISHHLRSQRKISLLLHIICMKNNCRKKMRLFVIINYIIYIMLIMNNFSLFLSVVSTGELT